MQPRWWSCVGYANIDWQPPCTLHPERRISTKSRCSGEPANRIGYFTVCVWKFKTRSWRQLLSPVYQHCLISNVCRSDTAEKKAATIAYCLVCFFSFFSDLCAQHVFFINSANLNEECLLWERTGYESSCRRRCIAGSHWQRLSMVELSLL